MVEGSRLANQAGQALGQIETVSKQLAELIQAISDSARQQAQASESISQSMSDISDITQRTATGTRQGAMSVNRLAALADELRASVSAFRLPDQPSQLNLPLRSWVPLRTEKKTDTARLVGIR